MKYFICNQGILGGCKNICDIKSYFICLAVPFHDHIIRDREEMNRIRKYIVENPGQGSADRNHNEGLYR